MTSKSFIEHGMIQWRIVLTMCAILAGFGVYSFLTMQRQEFPDFTIRQGIVVGVMPGASSQEVEEQLTRPVEDYLFSFNEVDKKKTYSVSKDGQVVVFVELNGWIKGQEAPAFWAKLRHGLNELKAQQLPSQVLALIGNNDFGDTSAILFTVVADGRSPRDLETYLDVLQSHLRRIDATAKLRTIGAQEEVITIAISRDRLSRYGVRPATLWASLQGLGAAPVPARLDTDELEFPVHVSKVLKSEAELGDTILLSLPTGAMVRLKDVAEIKRAYRHDDAQVRFNGKTAMVLSIEMQSGNDITRFGDEVDRALDATRRELPPGVTIARVADQPKVVRTSVNHFVRDFGLAIAAVILVTMLLLPLRVAAVAAISIPVSIAATLAILNALDVQLQTVSLAGLVVVLGMVVDNAIVIIDDHLDKLEHGLDPWTAAWKSARELMVPVFTATVAIILAYAPMPLFMTGTAGDFIGSLPLTIAVALFISLLVALLLIPVMNSCFIRRGLHRKQGRRSVLDRLQGWFDRGLDAAFRHPVVTVTMGVGSVVLAGVLGSRIPQQMFPTVDRDSFAVEVYLPSGRSLKQTDAVIRQLEAELLRDKRVVNVTAFVGQSSPRFHTAYAPHMPARNYGQLLVNTVDDKATLAVLAEYRRHFKGAFPDAWVRWKQLELNIGSPIEVRLSGTDIPALKAAAAKLEAHLRTISGTGWVRNDYEEALQAIEVMPDVEACARLGVPPAMLQASLAVGAQGFPLGTVWEGEDAIRVVLEEDQEAAGSIEGLRQQYVSSMLGGASVPLEQLATLGPVWHEGAIVRRNGVRTLTVVADLDPGTFSVNVQKDVERFVQTMELAGIQVAYGGEKELTKEAFTPMTVSMVVSICLIALVMLCQFQRFRLVWITMLAMPLSLLGAFVGLKTMGYPFGLTAFLGIIGLLGIVVRNGIILVTCAEQLRGQGLGRKEAALAAGKRRMRPIYLTSMAAAIGVVPMILSKSLLWGPLGTVTCFGLIIAMVLTLFVLPVAYWLLASDHVSGARQAAKAAASAGLVALLVLVPGAAQAGEGARAGQGPFTLAELQTMALKHNVDTETARLEIEAAQETKAAVRTKYFPQVSASLVGLVALKPLVEIESSGGNLPVYDGNPANLATATQFAYMPATSIGMADYITAITLMAVQPVYMGGRVRNGNRLAALGVDVAQDKAAMSGRDVVARTEDKYWRLITLAEKMRTLEAYERLLESLDRQVSDAVQAGLLTENDLLKVRLKRSEAAVDRLRLESGRRLAARDLRRHIGLAEGDEIALADGLTAPADPTSLAGARAGAASRRPELRLLESGVRAAKLQTALKRGEMLPSVAVGAAVFRADVGGMPDMTNGVLFGTVSVPISAIWEGRHQTASLKKQEQIAARKLADVRALVDLEVEKTWTDLVASYDATKVADEAVAQAEVNLKEESDRYSSGLIAFSDLLEAQVLRQQALDKRHDARADYWLKRSAYERAVGRDQPGR